MDLTELRLILIRHFSLEELYTLCFDLNVDHQSLPGEGLDAKARELISFLSRQDRIDELVEVCKRLRPIAFPTQDNRKYFVASSRSNNEIDEIFHIWGERFDRTHRFNDAYFVIFDLNKPPSDWVRYVGGPEPPFPIIIFTRLDGDIGDELDGKRIQDIISNSYLYPLEVCRTPEELAIALKKVEWNYSFHQRIEKMARQLNLTRARLMEGQ